jgi:hypothetical protein
VFRTHSDAEFGYQSVLFDKQHIHPFNSQFLSNEEIPRRNTIGDKGEHRHKVNSKHRHRSQTKKQTSQTATSFEIFEQLFLHTSTDDEDNSTLSSSSFSIPPLTLPTATINAINTINNNTNNTANTTNNNNLFPEVTSEKLSNNKSDQSNKLKDEKRKKQKNIINNNNTKKRRYRNSSGLHSKAASSTKNDLNTSTLSSSLSKAFQSVPRHITSKTSSSSPPSSVLSPFSKDTNLCPVQTNDSLPQGSNVITVKSNDPSKQIKITPLKLSKIVNKHSQPNLLSSSSLVKGKIGECFVIKMLQINQKKSLYSHIHTYIHTYTHTHSLYLQSPLKVFDLRN